MAVPQYKHPRWLALISFLVVASGTLAAQGNSGTITMTGHVVESACTFEADMGTSVVASGTALHVGVSRCSLYRNQSPRASVTLTATGSSSPVVLIKNGKRVALNQSEVMGQLERDNSLNHLPDYLDFGTPVVADKAPTGATQLSRASLNLEVTYK